MRARGHNPSRADRPGGAGAVGGTLRGFTLVERPAASARKGSAFTLVELLVVMMIIALLVGILVPTLGRMRRNTIMALSQARINMLEGACQAYRSDLGEYPPSVPGGTLNCGARRLVQCLTGYMPEGTFDPNTGVLTGGDGCAGYGFRLIRRGDVYGPYNGTEGLPAAGNPPVFTDAFGYTIFYYRYDKRGSDTDYRYYYTDNPTDPLGGASPPGDYAAKPGGGLYRTDVLLVSAGPNGTFTRPAVDLRTDDASNLFP